MTIATTERRLARGPAVRGYGEQEPLAAPFRSDGSGDRDPLTLRRWRVSLARNVNLLHPRAKTVFAMRVLDRRLGFRSRSSVRLERHFGLRLPSALLFGLEPENTTGCPSCGSHGGCPREGMGYRDLARTVEEGSRLGIRLYMTAGSGAARYWPELLDLSLRYPDRTFLLFAGPDLLSEAARESSELVRIGEEAAAAGNLGFVLPADGCSLSASTPAGGLAEVLREVGAPFGFAARVSGECAEALRSDSWVEEMLDLGCLFGFFYPEKDGGDHELGRAVRRLQQAVPVWTLSLEHDVLFSGERAPRSGSVPGPRDPRPALVVHPVTPRIRCMTLLESIETAAGVAHDGSPVAACPLGLDRGDTRGVLYALLKGACEPGESFRAAESAGVRTVAG